MIETSDFQDHILEFNVKKSKNDQIEKFNVLQKHKEGTHLVTSQLLADFSAKIRANFNNCVGTVMADRHGLPMYSDVVDPLDENLLSLATVCQRRNIIDLSDYHRIIHPLSKNVRMMILLRKSRENYLHYGRLEAIIRENNPI